MRAVDPLRRSKEETADHDYGTDPGLRGHPVHHSQNAGVPQDTQTLASLVDNRIDYASLTV